MKKSNSLTVRYGVQQMTYWGMFAGVVSFAATYLLDKGFHASQVGIILACANFSSCMLQPMLASYADRLSRPILPRLITMISALSFCCFGVILLLSPPLPLFAFLYFLGVMSLDAMLPLLNAINVYYNARQYHINYGIGRGLGSLAFSLSPCLSAISCSLQAPTG